MLKHKLMRSEPRTMAELMAIADKYAMADSAMQKPIRIDVAGKVVMDAPADDLLADADVREFYLGLGTEGAVRRSFRDVKHYKRRKRWLS